MKNQETKLEHILGVQLWPKNEGEAWQEKERERERDIKTEREDRIAEMKPIMSVSCRSLHKTYRIKLGYFKHVSTTSSPSMFTFTHKHIHKLTALLNNM